MFMGHRKWIWGLLAAVMLLGGCAGEAAPVGDVRDVILQAARTERPQVNLAAYRITEEELNEIYGDLLHSSALPWYVDKTWSYDYRKNGTVVTLYLTYLDAAVYDRETYEKAVEDALEQAVHPGMTELQIALSVHDYLAAHCSYDESLTHHTEYDALVGGTAVCQGYAEAYMDLLNRAGVECVVVDSETMDHSWNQVKIDGRWYNVDVTWDDPTPDTAGQVIHDHFLRSDAGISGDEKPHYGWESVHECTDTSYESGDFWTGVYSAIWYADADTCYLRRRSEDGYTVLRRDEASGVETELYAMELQYSDLGGTLEHRTHYYTTGLTMTEQALYITDIDRVLRLELETGAVTTEYEHDIDQTHQVLVGSYLEGRILTLTAMDAEREMYRFQQVVLEP